MTTPIPYIISVLVGFLVAIFLTPPRIEYRDVEVPIGDQQIVDCLKDDGIYSARENWYEGVVQKCELPAKTLYL